MEWSDIKVTTNKNNKYLVTAPGLGTKGPFKDMKSTLTYVNQLIYHPEIYQKAPKAFPRGPGGVRFPQELPVYTLQEQFAQAWLNYTNPAMGPGGVMQTKDPRLDPRFESLRKPDWPKLQQLEPGTPEYERARAILAVAKPIEGMVATPWVPIGSSRWVEGLPQRSSYKGVRR